MDKLKDRVNIGLDVKYFIVFAIKCMWNLAGDILNHMPKGDLYYRPSVPAKQKLRPREN